MIQFVDPYWPLRQMAEEGKKLLELETPKQKAYTMKQADFDIVVQETVKSIQHLLVSKGEEYAGSADRLANFKRGSNLVGVTPLQVAFIYASKHYDAISTYVRKNASGIDFSLTEPIEGRLDDLINYCILMKAIIHENELTKIDLTKLNLS